MFELLIYIVVGVITIGIPLLYFFHERRKNIRVEEIFNQAVEQGRGEPVSLHPYIDPAICIGSGACVSACPEGDILGLIHNRATLIKPSNCIGHGECQAACPVNAITLVFGTEKRGIDIPYLKGNFETNVPGIYIAGELGGMGLIRNAVIQGREAVEYIAKDLEKKNINGIYDLIIIGAGPAGISASLQARKEKLNFITIDQEDLGGTILSYPRRKLVMTQTVEFPLAGKIKLGEILKEELLELFIGLFEQSGLEVNSGSKVDEIISENGNFRIVTSDGEYVCQKVLLAIGRRGSPRKLGVPGEKSDKVSYRLLDPDKFYDMNIMVVGGGDSAIEAALALSEQPGNTVTISYRKETFFRIKDGNRSRIEEAIAKNIIYPYFNSQVTKIEANEIILMQEGKEVTLTNDYVFVFIGGELPIDFLKKAGIEFTRKFGEK